MNTLISYSSDVLNNLLSFLLIYRYVALFFITFLSAVGLPIPSTSVVIASAAFSSQGYFNFFYVIFTAQIGNIMGDITAYNIARYYGKTIIDKIWILKKIFSFKGVGNIEEVLRRHPKTTIISTRFMSQIGPIVDYLSGLIGLNYKKYILLIFFGELLQLSLFSSIGYFLGDQWQNSLGLVGSLSILIFILVVLYIIKKIFTKQIQVSA